MNLLVSGVFVFSFSYFFFETLISGQNILLLKLAYIANFTIEKSFKFLHAHASA